MVNLCVSLQGLESGEGALYVISITSIGMRKCWLCSVIFPFSQMSGSDVHQPLARSWGLTIQWRGFPMLLATRMVLTIPFEQDYHSGYPPLNRSNRHHKEFTKSNAVKGMQFGTLKKWGSMSTGHIPSEVTRKSYRFAEHRKAAPSNCHGKPGRLVTRMIIDCYPLCGYVPKSGNQEPTIKWSFY